MMNQATKKLITSLKKILNLKLKQKSNMKKIITGIIIVVVIGAIASLGYLGYNAYNQGKQAVEFNNKVVEEQNKFVTSFLDLSSNSPKYSDEELKVKFDETLTLAEGNLETIRNLETPENGTEFKKAAEDLFEFYVKILKNDFKEMLELSRKEELTTTERAKILELQTNITNEEAKYDKAFSEAQKTFTEKYGITLEENTLQEDINNLN